MLCEVLIEKHVTRLRGEDIYKIRSNAIRSFDRDKCDTIEKKEGIYKEGRDAISSLDKEK